MKENNKLVQPIIEGAIVTAVVVFIGLLSAYLTPLLLALYPVAVIVHGVKRGFSSAVIAISIASLTVGIATGSIINGVILLINFGPLSLGLIYAIKNRRKPFEILITGVVLFFVSNIFVFYLVDLLTGVNIISELEAAFKETVLVQLEMLEGMELSNYEIDNARTMLEEGYRHVILIMPALIMLLSLIVSYVNYLLFVLISKKQGIGNFQMPLLHKFSVPNNFAVGILVMFVGVFIVKSIDSKYYDIILLNLVIMVGMIFIIQGLAVINFFTIKWNLNRFMRGLVIFLVVAFSPALTVVSLIGAVDIVLDFRKIIRKSR